MKTRFAALVVAITTALFAALATPVVQAADAGVDVIELKAPRAEWFTAELAADARVAAASGRGIAIPDGVVVPASALAFTGIRPGSWMISPSGCTLNFVFGSLTPNDTYIGTAGHCTEVGDEVTIVAAPGILMTIGRTVKSVDNDIGDDFALIQISSAMVKHVRPSMAYFGGPTSAGNPQVGSIVEHAGHGLVIGTGGTPRAGIVTYRGRGESSRSDAFGWDGAAAPGDSGSPVRLANGAAAGDLTHLVVGGKYVPAVVAGTSIARMLRIAGKPLATAPNVPNPL